MKYIRRNVSRRGDTPPSKSILTEVCEGLSPRGRKISSGFTFPNLNLFTVSGKEERYHSYN